MTEKIYSGNPRNDPGEIRRPSETDPMERLMIEGGHRIRGKLPVGGSKNTVLMMMAAAVLGKGRTKIHNVSVLHDVWTFAEVIRSLGCEVQYEPDDDPTTPETIVIDAGEIENTEPPGNLIQALRASFYLFGALVGRCGEARVTLPGGDAWGSRPVNLHLEGLRALGAEVELSDITAVARVPGGRLRGGVFHLEPSSVGATVNLMLAAVTARGTSRITNAAREPDVVAFGEMLRAMGARIDGMGTPTIEIEGVPSLSPVRFRNPSDRIEAGTYVITAAIAGETGAVIRVTNCDPDHLGDDFFHVCSQAGIALRPGPDWVDVTVPDTIGPVSVSTAPYPGFPTDLQAQWTVMMTCSRGRSRVADPIYPERFQHVPELKKMGADIRVVGNAAIIGKSKLHGAEVKAADVRAGVALVIAGLIADGITMVGGLHHLDRGYERLEEKLKASGIPIQRVRVNG